MGGKQPRTTYEKMRAEYAAGASMRALAAKYHVSQNSIEYRSRKENWKAEREKFQTRSRDKAMRAAYEKTDRQYRRLFEASEKLLGKIEGFLDEVESSDIKEKPVLLRQVSGAILDCQAAMGIRSPKEREEQEARIDVLRARAEAIRRETEPEKSEALEVMGVPEGFGK